MPIAALLVIGTLVSGSASDQDAKSSGPDPGFHPVDLSTYYNKRAGRWPPGSCWSAVPWGRRVYDGVPFECGGVLEVAGLDAARRIGEVFRGRFTGIPVGSAGTWLHILHGTGWSEADGVPIARLAVHYENGQTTNLLISYGVHVRNWWQEPSESESRLSDPNSKVAWSAPNPEQAGRPTTLRFFKSSFANPHPSWVIATLDIESLFSRATPVVVAITVGKAGEGVKPQPIAAMPLPGRFNQRMVVKAAASGQPINGARVEVVLSDGELLYLFGTQTTDAAGRTILEFSREPIRELILSVSAPGYTPFQLNRDIVDLPPELELKLETPAQ